MYSYEFGKFMLIFPEICNYLCKSAVSKSSIAKRCCKICTFLINNSPDLYALTLRIMLKNNSFLAQLSGMWTNSNENYRHYNFRAFANILKFLENLVVCNFPHNTKRTSFPSC